MPRPVTLVLTKTFNIDLDSPDLKPFLVEVLRDQHEPGTADSSAIHDAIRSMLEDDFDTLVDLEDITSDDFKIEVPAGTTMEVEADDTDGDSSEG